MNKKLYFLGGVVVLVFVIGQFSLTGLVISEQNIGTVYRIIDGDTVVLKSNEERVRLLGIDTPEKGQPYSEEATHFLKKHILGKEVRLEADEEIQDKYGRSLLYLFRDGVFINEEIVRQGLATVLTIPPNEKYTDLLEQAEQEARENRRGIWSVENQELFCLGIIYFRDNAKGNDNQNLNDEFVILRNECEEEKDLTGWVVTDAGKNSYTFPEFSLGYKERVTLHTGSGQDNETNLFWGKKRAVWNNNGDTFTMKNTDGEVMVEYKY